MQDEAAQEVRKQEIKAKRTVKNSVFLDLFQDKGNLLKLYKTLHPEDTDVTEDALDIVTINNILTDNLYNDLGIMVGDSRLLLLLEAQSSWTINILVRILLYLAQTYHEYFERTGQSLYRNRKVKMPRPELYVIYTGNRGKKPGAICLSEEFFEGADTDIEVKAKVIYESGSDDIINQYIIFCKVFDEQRKLHGMTEQTVRETIRICKDRDILREYLTHRETEVVSIMTSLFDQEQIFRTYLQGVVQDAVQEAVQETKNAAAYNADSETAERMIRKGKMTLEEIADYVPSLSLEELKKIERKVMQTA